MAIRTSFKISLKLLAILNHYEMVLLYYKTTMYHPFYYSFIPRYAYSQYPVYPYDVNSKSQFFSSCLQIAFEEKNQKNQQVNTNQTDNGLKQEEKQELIQSSNTSKHCHFLLANEDLHQNQLSFKKVEEKQVINKPNYRMKNDQTQRLRYVNKNFESNIINKIFSFLWSEDKSKIYVTKILKDKTKVNLYFDYMKIIRKYSKRYINKEYLQNLCDYQPQHIAYRIVARNNEKLKYFSMDELSKTIRKVIYIYLKDICSLSILTSKKMRVDIWTDHFQKSRNIYGFLFQGMSSEQYDQRMSKGYQKIYKNGQIM